MSNLTYDTLSGKPRLRRFAIVAVFLLMLALLVGLWASVQKSSEQAIVLATPIPLGGELSVSTSRSTDLPPSPTAAPLPCPTNHQNWRLLSIFPDDNFKKIEPVCIYDSLSRTVAWHFLTRLGYTAAEAAESLGFDAIPQGDYRETVMGMTNTKGPMAIALIYELAHHNLRQWLVSSDGTPASTYSLRGCYRTATVTGNQVDDWDTGYPIICVVAVDMQAAWGVFQLGDHLFASPGENGVTQRGFLLFGYLASQEEWELIGQQDAWAVIEAPESLAESRENYAQKYGTTVWDIEWLAREYGLEMTTLPNGWSSHTDPADIQAILDEINR